MKNHILGSLLVLGSLAAPAAAGPDFHTPNRHGTDLTASSGTRDMLPSDDVIFAHNSDTLTESGQAQLETIARVVKLRRDLQLVIEGYTDYVGDAAYNLDLATRRAAAVRSYLRVHGVPSDRMVLAIYGESVANPRGNPLDRRVVVHASLRSARELATNALDIRKATSVTWTFNGSLHTEERSERYVRISARR
jgi:outer membrane protein OmpA-like peptidoglycan-associated protein